MSLSQCAVLGRGRPAELYPRRNAHRPIAYWYIPILIKSRHVYVSTHACRSVLAYIDPQQIITRSIATHWNTEKNSVSSMHFIIARLKWPLQINYSAVRERRYHDFCVINCLSPKLWRDLWTDLHQIWNIASTYGVLKFFWDRPLLSW